MMRRFDLLIKNNIAKLVADNCLDIITFRDLDGQYFYASSAIKNILGYSPEEFVGTSRQDYMDPIDFAKSERKYKNVNYINKPITYSYRFRHKDGHYIWLESTFSFIRDNNNQTFILAISRDITKRKQIEANLRAKKQNYRLLVEESPYAIIILQKEKWAFVNDTAVKLLGATRKEEILGKSPFEFVHPDYRNIVINAIKQTEKGIRIEASKERWIRLDGEVIDVQVKAIPTFFNGQPAIQVVVIDLSEKLKVHALAQHSEKMSSVSQLAAGIAHEIRNPLTTLKGFLQLIQSNTSINENKDYFNIMFSELNRIESILNELLVLGKPHTANFTQFTIQHVLDQVITIMNTQAIMYNVVIQKVFECVPIYIKGDINQLKQVFMNLFKNAIEAMPTGGVIIANISQLEGQAFIRIIDQGIGIPNDLIKKIGEPFYTTKETGTGLGLMVTKEIIKHHHGKIRFLSEIMKGTTVEIQLPLIARRLNPIFI